MGWAPSRMAQPHHEFLAVLVIGYSDDLSVDYIGMGVEEFFDLAGVDVLATTNHHIFDAAGYFDESVLVHHREVATVNPAVGVDGPPQSSRVSFQ